MSHCDVAICRRCRSHNVAMWIEHVAGRPVYHFRCNACGHTTPARPEVKQADADVDWTTIRDRRMPA